MERIKSRPFLPINRESRRILALPENRYSVNGQLILNSRREARELALLYKKKYGSPSPSAGDLYGAAHIVLAWELLLDIFSKGPQPFEKTVLKSLDSSGNVFKNALSGLIEDFPVSQVWNGRQTPRELILSKPESTLRNWSLIRMTQENPAFRTFHHLYHHPEESKTGDQEKIWPEIERIDSGLVQKEPENAPSLATLRKPVEAAPNSIKDQLLYILINWSWLLGDWVTGLLAALDMIEEETRPHFGGSGPAQGPGLDEMDTRALFSRDDDWMPHVVLLAKNVLVWLDQLSKTYGREIRHLDDIPEEELSAIASRGFNALWLIGLWERSPASRKIKQHMGNPEAAASAYSLFGYSIAHELGGGQSLENLKERAARYGIRLSSDMVPNHVGIDSDWVRHYPERLLSVSESPFPAYSFNGENLSDDNAVDIRLEDHYWDKSDAAVVFRRQDRHSGDTHYIYHGNDGTSMPWNDTAQIDFLNPEAREAVIQDILHVARIFPIIRFDAAMVLARKHIRRLWFPPLGGGGGIPSRSEYAMTDQEFRKELPVEFWREVVDRVAAESPGTLLLAEAFWMMEGYFVRTLGMHRVYNSAFMNMLRDQNNAEYRAIIKKTLAFDPRILQRFVNFMNNPDEETAVDQFGKDDRYFAVCTLLATLPGLPMFGHGQIEGLSEKYGMEYIKAYRNESPDIGLIMRHDREIFPILSKRYLFAGAESFRFYDFHSNFGVNESVYAFSNAYMKERTLVLVNNSYEKAHGHINQDIAASLLDGNQENYDWFLRKDMLSGLWYIRSMADFKRWGLEISIEGFGRHVCLEFRAVKETEDGLWGILASEIGIQGIADPDSALNDIRLRPVKESLNSLLSATCVKKIFESLRSGQSAQWPEDRLKVCGALNVLIDFNPFINKNADILIEEIRYRLEASSKLWRLFRRGLRRSLKRHFGRLESDDAVFLALYSVLSLCAKGQWKEWQLESWLIKQHSALVLPETRQELACAMTLPEWKIPFRKPHQILRTMMTDSEIRRICGVNSWDGQLWYTLEGWITFGRAFVLSTASESQPRTLLKRIIRRWAKAHKISEYKLDALLQALR